MNKIENNRIYYDPYNEIRCDKFALEKLVKESEEKDKTIADLEAKLAESEIRSKESEIFYKREINRRDTKLRNIKQQLAEKEELLEESEECKEFNAEMWTRFANKCKDLTKQLAEKEKELKAKETLNQIFKDNRDDKISFAIKQLEKVKTSIEDADNNNAIYIRVNDFEVIDEIFYNQIKQLKEGK